MSAKHGTRYKIMKGGILAGAIFSFIPAFALVKSHAAANAGAQVDDGTVSAPTYGTGDRTVPSYSLPSTNQQTTPSRSVLPSQTQPRNTVPVQPRARTRAS